MHKTNFFPNGQEINTINNPNINNEEMNNQNKNIIHIIRIGVIGLIILKMGLGHIIKKEILKQLIERK